jgi:hypothetical protein
VCNGLYTWAMATRRLLAAAAIGASYLTNPTATNAVLGALVAALTIGLLRNARTAAR